MPVKIRGVRPRLKKGAGQRKRDEEKQGTALIVLSSSSSKPVLKKKKISQGKGKGRKLVGGRKRAQGGQGRERQFGRKDRNSVTARLKTGIRRRAGSRGKGKGAKARKRKGRDLCTRQTQHAMLELPSTKKKNFQQNKKKGREKRGKRKKNSG